MSSPALSLDDALRDLQLPSLDVLKADLAKQSFPDFIRQAWPIVEPQTPLVWNWHLDEICDVLEKACKGKLFWPDGRPVKRIIINIPPGLGKSLIVSVFLNAWEWANDASLRYLTASYSDDNTIRDNRRLRSIIVSDWYKKNFNVQLSSDQAAKIRFDTTKSGWRIATSIGGMGRGEHPHRVVIDDPHKDASSVAEMEQGIKWADGTLSTRIALNPIVFLIMQRLHLKDLSAHFLEKGGWYHVAFPMRYVSVGGLDCECHRENPDPRDHRKEDGELLWPEQWPEEKVYQEEIDLGPFGASGQLGQKPVPEGGGLFKREWFEIVDVLPKDLDLCRGWDTAESDDAGDWTVGVKLGKSRSTGMIYVADVERERKTLVDTLFKRVAQSDGVRCKIREGAGAGKAVTKARSILLQGYDYATSPESDSKIERANPFRAQCEMGNVKVLRAAWNEAYLSVVTSFPVGKYDDDVDASSNAFNELVGIKKVSVVWGRGRK